MADHVVGLSAMVCLMLGEIGEINVFRHFTPVAVVEAEGPEHEGLVEAIDIYVLCECNPAGVFLCVMGGLYIMISRDITALVKFCCEPHKRVPVL